MKPPSFTIGFDFFGDPFLNCAVTALRQLLRADADLKVRRHYMCCSYLYNDLEYYRRISCRPRLKTMKFRVGMVNMVALWLVNLPPPNVPHHRNKSLIRPYQRKPIVNKPFIRLCFWLGYARTDLYGRA